MIATLPYDVQLMILQSVEVRDLVRYCSVSFRFFVSELRIAEWGRKILNNVLVCRHALNYAHSFTIDPYGTLSWLACF